MASEDKRAEDLINVMRQIPFPVTVVTASNGSSTRGITIGSFTSLSMEPPLISFNVEKESQMHEILQECDSFVVQIPHAAQDELCTRFALPDQSDEEQFEGIAYRLSEKGVPILEDVVAVLECSPYKWVDAGDHTLIIGEVEKVEILKNDPAILYLNGAYLNM
ncbi:MAG: flavin reductase family protein [Balneolaceae bacterium]